MSMLKRFIFMMTAASVLPASFCITVHADSYGDAHKSDTITPSEEYNNGGTYSLSAASIAARMTLSIS